MTFTDEQLWAAVRSAGRDGKSFTAADVRDALGMTATKSTELSKFRDRFRAFRLTAGASIEKIGKTAYRLNPAVAQPAAAASEEIEVEIISEDADVVEVAPIAPAAETEVASADTAPVVPEPVVVAAAPVAEAPVIAPAEEPSETSALQASAADSELAVELSEAMIEAEVRALVSVPELPEPTTTESLIAQAEQPLLRTWLDRGQWLGRRFAELFSRS